MPDEKKTSQELIHEPGRLHRQVEPIKSESDYKQTELEWKALLLAEQKQRLRAEVLAEVTLALTSQIEPEAVLDEILRQTHRLIPYHTAHIMLLKDDTLIVAHWQGYQQYGSENFIGTLVQPVSKLPLDQEVIRSQAALVISDTRQEPNWVTFDETAWVLSALMLPICLRDKTLGILRLDSDTPNQFSPSDAEQLQPLANAAAIALENSRQFEQTQIELAERKQLEMLLRANKARYQAIVEDQTELICRYQPDKTITFVNEAYCKRLGKRKEELMGHSLDIPIGNQNEDFINTLNGNLTSNKPVNTFEHCWQTKDGQEEYWYQWTNRAIFDEYHQIIEYQIVGLDITRRKNMEVALKQSEQRFRSVIETANDAIISTNSKGFITDWNQGAVKIFGYTAQEAVGKPFTLIMPKYLAKPAQEKLKQIADNEDGLVKGSTLELVGLRKDGTEFPVELSIASWESRNKTHYTGIIRDVTERVRAEEELKCRNQELIRLTQAHRRLITAIEQTAESVVITDKEGVILYVNPAFVRASGYNPKEIINQTTPKILKSGKHPVTFYRNLWATISSGRVWHGHLINRRKDGSLYTEEATISPVRDEMGEIVNYVAVKRDVTRELQLETQYQQAQKMESIGQLAGGVAHDFNNILSIINGHCELLLDNELSFESNVRADIETIKEACDRATTLTRQLLAFGRRQTLHPKPQSLNDIVLRIEKMVRSLIGENIILHIRLAPKLHKVRVDRNQLELAIMNLVVNARDAMPQGGELTIDTMNTYLNQTFAAEHVDITPGAYVMLSISDTGFGMDAETQTRAFEPFFTTKKPGKGTGLGLATVHGIVQQSGGHIWVESIMNQGTIFKLILPQIKEEPETPATETQSGNEEALNGSETILLVEDDPNVRLITCKFLKNRGYRVIEAGHAEEALQTFRQYKGSVDLLIADIVLPGQNGRELATLLTQLSPQLKVLYISGYSDKIPNKNGILAAGTHFLEKPYSSKELALAVHKVLRKRAE